MFRKSAFGTDNLAAATETATTADRVNIHTQYTRCVEQRCIHRKAATATRGREDDFNHVITIHSSHVIHRLARLFFYDRHEPDLPLQEPVHDRL